MITVCPNCSLTLAVTADDLRAGQGYVRCGRCMNVFNALMSLSQDSPGAESAAVAYTQADPASSSQISRALASSDEDQASDQAAPPLPAAPSLTSPDTVADPGAITDEHEILLPDDDESTDNDDQDEEDEQDEKGEDDEEDDEDLESEDDNEYDEVEVEVENEDEDEDEEEEEEEDALSVAEIIDPLMRQSTEANSESHPQLATEVSDDGAFENESTAADGTGTFETIVLEGDAITQTEEFAPQEAVDHELAVLAQRLKAQPAPESEPHSAEAAANVPAADKPDLITDSELLALGLDLEPLHAQPEPYHRAWMAGCILLAALLIMQALNHWRDDLASVPALTEPMTQLYQSIGVPLDPHWDLNAYDIRQQGAFADPGDSHVIRVRLSVANHAERSQPMPLLRLTLLDRYGKRIAARDLRPEDYWPRGQKPRSFLAHDERIDSEVAVRDQGPDSASFELDVCLRNLSNVIRCAGDAAPTGAGTT
jgi:predicted Zn finger-like uncharacterized protein